MKTTNFCRMIGKDMAIKLNRWAKMLEAEEMTIHHDGTVTLTCNDGIICENYRPTAKELMKC